MPAILFPQIDPIIFKIGSFSIHWYAIAYVMGIILGFVYLRKLNKLKPVIFNDNALDDIIIYAVLGIILGGRFGYIFFYSMDSFLSNPTILLQIWKGGMSYHGGMLGLIIALYFLARKHKLHFIRTLDLVTCVAPIGLFFGRIANFINAELVGRTTDAPWGVIFPYTNGEPRHPSQLYEAALEGILLFIIMSVLVRINSIRTKPGMLGGIFIALYGVIRIFIEFFREPDQHLGYYYTYFTMGQFLSLPMIIIGCYFIFRKAKLQR